MNEKLWENQIIEYKKIIDRMILKSFPKLKNKKIKIYELKTNKVSANVERLPFFLKIRTNKILRDYNQKLLEGVFSHELCHLETFVSQGLFKFYFLGKFLSLFEGYIRLEERNTDILAIKKGYAKQLYSQRKLRWSAATPKMQKRYLSPKELMNIAISFKKW